MDGSSTVFPITEAVVEEFVHAFPGQYKPTVGVSGTGGGFKKFCRDETDLTNASRGIKPKEVKDCLANGIRFLELTVAYDGLSIVVHPSNTWVDHITVAELKKIWEPEAQGRITRWNQIRPEWPDKEIHLYGAGVASGTYDYFTEAIVGKSHSSRGDYTSSEDDNVLLTGVAGDPLSLGFFGIAYYEENKQNLKLVPLDDEKPENGAGPIIPTRANIMSNRYAPLSRPLFVYVNSAATQRPEVQRFVRFYLDRVAGLVDEVGYVPLPDSLYARERRNFEAFLQANAASTPVRSPRP
jgi:phosphate transport system substrate-binding protein